MSVRTKDLLIKYAITIVVGLLLFGLHFWLRYDAESSYLDKLTVICDGFTIPGLILTGFALLLFASTFGAFDGVGYGLRIAATMLFPTNWKKRPERYQDYLERKKNSRVKGFWYILHVGLVFLLIAIIILIYFMKIDA